MDWKKDLKETNWLKVGFMLLILWLFIDIAFFRENLPRFPAEVEYVMALGIIYLCGIRLFEDG